MGLTAREHTFSSADGLRLFCRVYPGGASGTLPVLCLPGLTRNSRDFAALAAHLSPTHEVLTPDLRGRGRSDFDPDPSRYQLQTYVNDAFALLDALGRERVIVIGTSLGALMGMVMAAMKPARIAALVLNDAGPELDPAGVRRIAGYAGKLPPVTSWAEAAAQTRSVYGAALPGLDEAAWLDYARRGYRENPQGIPVPDVDPRISEAFKQTSSTPLDLWPVFAAIHAVPVLVIRGATSDILSAQTLARMAKEHPHLEQATIPNRGHTPLLDEREALSAIDAFLARYGRVS
ncbi:MAG TPA: alpha/beta hydrolase [Steroidobacteraceae bacterium]|nr:alpha/beta hydrolase [Steroidobacteraceae bacterium]